MMKLGLFLHGPGHNIAAWRDPAPIRPPARSSATTCTSRSSPSVGWSISCSTPTPRRPSVPTTSTCGSAPRWRTVSSRSRLLGALAAVTQHIGLVATATTTYLEPFHVARMFASLDQLSEGRTGWNVVTSSAAAEALNFSHAAHAPHSERYARAAEFVQVVLGLWDTWEDDAFVLDKTEGPVLQPGQAAHAQSQGQALLGTRPADDSAFAAGPAGYRPRRSIGGRALPRRAGRRCGVLGRAGHREGARILRRYEEPCGQAWPPAGLDQDHAGRAGRDRRAARPKQKTGTTRYSRLSIPSLASRICPRWWRWIFRHTHSMDRCRTCR